MLHRPRSQTTCSVLLAVLVTACSTLPVSSERDASADFSSLQTFAWAPVEQTGAEAVMDGARLDRVIREAFEAGLAERGYRPAPDGAPDVLLQYRAAVKREVRTQSVAVGRSGATRSVPVTHEIGSLVLLTLDPASSRPIWQGSVQAELDRWAETQEREARLRSVVADILDRYPKR